MMKGFQSNETRTFKECLNIINLAMQDTMEQVLNNENFHETHKKRERDYREEPDRRDRSPREESDKRDRSPSRQRKEKDIVLHLLLLQERLPVQPMVPSHSATVAEDSCPTNIMRIPVGISEIDLRVGIRITNPSLG